MRRLKRVEPLNRVRNTLIGARSLCDQGLRDQGLGNQGLGNQGRHWLFTAIVTLLLCVTFFVAYGLLMSRSEELTLRNAALELKLHDASIHRAVYQEFLQMNTLRAVLDLPVAEYQSAWIQELESLSDVTGIKDSAFQLEKSMQHTENATANLVATVSLTLLHEGHLMAALNAITQSSLPVEVTGCEVTRTQTGNPVNTVNHLAGNLEKMVTNPSVKPTVTQDSERPISIRVGESVLVCRCEVVLHRLVIEEQDDHA